MKKYLAVLLIIVMCLFVSSCSNKTEVQTKMQKATQNTQNAETEHETETPTKATKAPTEKPTPAPTEKPTQAKKEENWKKLYINKLNSLDKEQVQGFCLVQIDDNDIPELYAESVSHMVNSHLYWMYNEKLCEYSMFYEGLSYIEHENLFMNSGGFQGCCFDEVLSIECSTTNQIAHGDYVLAELAGFESYEWNGIEMSQSEYENAKNLVFDTSSATKPNTLYSYSDICKQITEW